MTDWHNLEELLPSFKDLYGNFGSYILARLKADKEVSVDESTAQLKRKGFGSAVKFVKDTNYIKTIVTAFHIPGSGGKIHHYDIDVYRFKRKKSSDPKGWERQELFSLREDEVQGLRAFLNEQNALLGLKFDDKYATVVYSSEPVNQNDVQAAQKLAIKLTPEQLEELLSSDEGIEVVNKSLPRLRVDLLQKLSTELSGLLEKAEMDVQQWLDENPKVRCLIFGLEYIDYRRETTFGNSKFDILTDVSGTEHVIIELKSPNKPVFQIRTIPLKNGVKKDYCLSPDLAEAIPQAIKYFAEYARESKETFRKNGTDQKKVPKVIIVIGRNVKDDPIWQDHYCDLRSRIAGIEILTYDHLIEKMQNQVTNLTKLSNDGAI
jgi:hypothetical protein